MNTSMHANINTYMCAILISDSGHVELLSVCNLAKVEPDVLGEVGDISYNSDGRCE